MNKREKETLQLQLEAEEDVLHELEKQYKKALADINDKIKLFEYDITMLDQAVEQGELNAAEKALALSQKRSKAYQKQYQEALQKQLEGILDKLQSDEYGTLKEYLDNCYNDAFIGTMYDLHGQGIPMIMPIDQAAAVKAILTDSKISKGLYTRLGVDVNGLKKDIRQEITRGIASGLGYADIARNISNTSSAPLARAKNIARTEGHRIQQASTMDAQDKAKARGADVVKQWDATLDGATRPVHRQLDGQIREVDEPFEAGGMKAMAPGHFGRASQDCNCRCVSLTRAKWALDEDELQTLKDRAKFFGLDKTESFQDFRKKYLKAAETVEKSEESGKIILPEAKLLSYSLNTAKSPDKAKAFRLALGYTAATSDLLKQNIMEHLDEEKLIEKGDNGYGMRYENIMELTGINGKKANVLTAWIQEGDRKRLVSAYVTQRKVTE